VFSGTVARDRFFVERVTTVLRADWKLKDLVVDLVEYMSGGISVELSIQSLVVWCPPKSSTMHCALQTRFEADCDARISESDGTGVRALGSIAGVLKL